MSRVATARRDVVGLILAAACWGLGTVVSKSALAEFPPLTLLPIQLLASVATLLLLMRRRGVPLRDGEPAVLGRLGLLNPGLAYALALLGLVTITASLSVLLWALEPLLIVVLAAWFLGERITRTFVVLSLAAVAGMVVIVYDPSAGGAPLGVVLTIAGIACCAAYTVITRRWIPAAAETGQVVLVQQVYGLVLAAALAVALGVAGGQVLPSSVTPMGLASAVGSGVLYYAAAYWLYLGALRNVPASVASVSFYLIPIVGVAAAAILLGERMDVRQWIGAVVVMLAVLGILRQPSGSERPSAADGLLGLSDQQVGHR